MITINEIKTEQELEAVLTLCYRILGTANPDLYGRGAWLARLNDGLQPMVCAQDDGKVVSAVLGRRESSDSLIIGFVACDEAYRRQGITKKLMEYFGELAARMGYKYITLGSQEDAFYEKCGYKRIAEIHGQSIYQKVL